MWRGIPAGQPKSKAPVKTSTNDARDRSGANKKAKDKAPSHKTSLQTRVASRKHQIHPATAPPAGVPPTTHRGAAFRQSVPACFPRKESPLLPDPLALSLISNLVFASQKFRRILRSTSRRHSCPGGILARLIED